MRWLQSDSPGPGQHQAIRGIRESQRIWQRGSSVEIRWVPDCSGVEGNGLAGLYASAAARMAEGLGLGGDISLAELKAARARRANDMWRDEIIKRNKGKRVFRCPDRGPKPRLRRGLSGIPGIWLPVLSVSEWTCNARPLLEG